MTGTRVWLVAGLSAAEPPVPQAVGVVAVRDDLLRVWHVDGAGWWHTADGRHHASWRELHDRFDLMEVNSDEQAA
jgi:hypothetical protein